MPQHLRNGVLSHNSIPTTFQLAAPPFVQVSVFVLVMIPPVAVPTADAHVTALPPDTYPVPDNWVPATVAVGALIVSRQFRPVTVATYEDVPVRPPRSI